MTRPLSYAKLINMKSIYDNMTEQEQLDAIRQSRILDLTDIIRNIDNPSEAVQLEAINKSWSSIDHIKKPSINVLVYLLMDIERHIQTSPFPIMSNHFKGEVKGLLKKALDK